MGEKYNLQWNSFQENLSGLFKDLRKETDYNDITLITEDGNSFQAHKLVISSSGPFFKSVLQKMHGNNNFLYMRRNVAENFKANNLDNVKINGIYFKIE